MPDFNDLMARMTSAPEPAEPKWGTDRRKAIVMAMAKDRDVRFEMIRYTRKVCHASSITDFFNRVADEAMMQEAERICRL